MRQLRELKRFFCLLPKVVILLAKEFFVMTRPMLGATAIFAAVCYLLFIYDPCDWVAEVEELPVWPFLPWSVVLLVFGVVFYSELSILILQMYLFVGGCMAVLVGGFMLYAQLLFDPQRMPLYYSWLWLIVGLSLFVLCWLLEKWQLRMARERWAASEVPIAVISMPTHPVDG